MNSPKPIKLKRCKVCREQFAPFNSIQPTCGKYECQVTYATAHAKQSALRRARQDRKETRAAKEAIKPLKKWLDEAQAAVNKWVREVRDRDLPCISCGRHANRYDAGHYRSRGAASHLRFNLDNIAKQCSRPCNHDLSGNIIGFRKGLVEKIGLERVEAIENDNTPHRWTIDEAKAIKLEFTRLLKKFKQEEK